VTPVSRGSLRIARACALVGDIEASDRILFTAPDDVRWLCGFSGSNGWLVVGVDSVVLLTDGRYVDQSQLEAASMGLEIDIAVLANGQSLGDLVAHVVPKGATSKSGRVLFQPEALNVAQFRSLEAALRSMRTAPDLEPAPNDLRRLRRHKDAQEIETIARAAAIADRALRETVPMLSSRPTERDVRDELEHRMRRLGADGPSYDTIVASGPVNAALPHHRPDSTVIEEGHAVVIDVGALVDGYHSDMTRTFLVGDVDPELLRLYEIVEEAQRLAVAAVASGVASGDVDKVCRDIFVRYGVEDLFIHGTGHGVGLAIHEDPYVGRNVTACLEVGDVVTVEPGLYRMGLGGVRIEDLLVVTEDAHRCLTTLPKDSPCLPSPPTT
jgi:Xaa-Pro aminopeptidase